MLDLKISQSRLNTYAVRVTKYDDVTLSLTVDTNDKSAWVEPNFELLGIKSDKNAVHQVEHFTVIDKENHIVQVKLDEQFVTCEGQVELQLVIKDGSRQSSTPFTLIVNKSLDSNILESHRNVKVLDELEKYIVEGREYISEATRLAQDTTNNTSTINTQAQANEAQRAQNELQRQQSETERVDAETKRKENEVQRLEKEQQRQSSEVARTQNEETRMLNENRRIERESAREGKEATRELQESTRQSEESIRKDQEVLRQSNESYRQRNESTRQEEESKRMTNEETRKKQETSRQSEETKRQSQEVSRQSQESNRQQAESTRSLNENTRQSQEVVRVTNEQNRDNQEQLRVTAENTRKEAESARITAEQNRVVAEEARQQSVEAIKEEATALLDALKDFEPITESDRTDYMGTVHDSLKKKNDADVEWLLGEVNTAHYEGQQITATNTLEGRSKSAILKGQTLVNQSTTSELAFENAWQGKNIKGNALQSGKKYFVSFDLESDNSELTIQARNGNSFVYHIHKGFTKGKNALSFILEQDSNGLRFQVGNDFNVKISNIIILEYKDGMENWDIPYFEGMQSVKLPVLTTTGKNLSPINDYETTVWEYANGHQGFNKVLAKNILVNENKEYRLSFTKECEDGLPTNLGYIIVQFSSIPVSSNIDDHNSVYAHCQNNKGKKYAHITMPNIGQGNEYVGRRVTLTNIQLEEGSVATSYEPYKSNILSCLEPVELGSVGEVKDELNLLTQQLTQRTETRPYQEGDELNSEFVTDMTNTRYKLAQEVVKTVDLSDNHVYSYKDVTHYTCSSEDGSLIPTLSVDVPTNLPALVSKQRDIIENQKEQIATLEIENKQLTTSQIEQDEEIMTNLLASVELFEMILSMMPVLENTMSKSVEVNPMVEVYVTLILKGQKTIDQVPVILRDKVQAQLDIIMS